MKPKFRGITFHATYRCNFNCRFCEVPAMRRCIMQTDNGFNELQTAEVKRILTDAKSNDFKQVFFTGGEPFLRQDMFDLIAYTSKLGLRLSINTRHTFSRDDVAKLESCTNSLHLWVSIDSHESVTAEHLGARKGFFENYIRGLEYLVSSKIPISCFVVVNRLNVECLDSLFSFIHELGVRRVCSMEVSFSTSCIAEYDRPGPEEANQLLLTDEDLIQAEQHEKKWMNSLEFIETVGANDRETPDDNDGPSTALSHTPRCNILKGDIDVRPDGKIIYCNLAHDLIIGDLRVESLDSVLSSDRLKNFLDPDRDLFRATKCFDCSQFEVCNIVGRCYKRTYQQYGKFFANDDKLCARYLS